MLQVKKRQMKYIKPNPGKRDILTEMFEHFGIEVIDVSSKGPKPKKKKMTE